MIYIDDGARYYTSKYMKFSIYNYQISILSKNFGVSSTNELLVILITFTFS